jgi:hypothetical protein
VKVGSAADASARTGHTCQQFIVGRMLKTPGKGLASPIPDGDNNHNHPGRVSTNVNLVGMGWSCSDRAKARWARSGVHGSGSTGISRLSICCTCVFSSMLAQRAAFEPRRRGDHNNVYLMSTSQLRSRGHDEVFKLLLPTLVNLDQYWINHVVYVVLPRCRVPLAELRHHHRGPLKPGVSTMTLTSTLMVTTSVTEADVDLDTQTLWQGPWDRGPRTLPLVRMLSHTRTRP